MILKKRQTNIIQQIKQGNEKPLFDLYKLYRNEFIAWSAQQFGASKEQAQDSFQDAILDFHQNIMSGKLTELISSEKTYLFQIGKHKILNIIKKESRITYQENLHLIKGKEIEDFMENDNAVFTQEQISDAINKLPNDCQQVLNLHYFKEYGMDSIARELNYKNADTAKSKKSVCMKRLIKELSKLKMLFII